MTLSFSDSRLWFDTNRMGLGFTAVNEGAAVQFLITAEALEALGLRDDIQRNAEAVFRANRRRIERVAADKFARGECVLLASDFLSGGQGAAISEPIPE